MSNCARAEHLIKPADLRGILRYVPMFREHIFVIAVDGSVVEHEDFANTVTDIAVLRSLNIRVVLVHGIGKQLRDAVEKNGSAQGDFYGEGVTDAPMLALARETAGAVAQTIVEALSHSSLKTALTNAVRVTETGVIHGVDQMFTGKVDKIDTGLLKNLLDQGIIPLFTPILCNREGRSLRVALGASKLIYLTSFPGLQINGSVVVNMPLANLSALIRERKMNLVEERLRSKALCAVRALENGTTRAHILDGRVSGGLLTEIFDKVGLGTMIHANSYQQIRPARKKDVQAIHALTKQGVRRETLVLRSRAHIEQHIDEYFVYEIDESVIGCACLRRYTDRRAVEVGSVYVQSFHTGRGVGRMLVEYAELRAAEGGASRLFALTTQSGAFFRDVCGFANGTLEDIPAQRRAEARGNGRNARVFLKKLASRKKSPKGDAA